MNIVAYQIDGSTCRFVYRSSNESLHVVSVENYRGMIDFLHQTKAEQLSVSVDIYQYAQNH